MAFCAAVAPIGTLAPSRLSPAVSGIAELGFMYRGRSEKLRERMRSGGCECAMQIRQRRTVRSR